MTDSRSVQSSSVLVPRAALPSPSASYEFPFACRVCGGSGYTVETRPFAEFEVVLAKLRAYQSVEFSALACYHRVFTCIRCEAAALAAKNALRDALIGKLLFAAKHLAERQFTRSNRYGRIDLICVECRVAQVSDGFLLHSENCRTGRVLRLLEALMGVDDPRILEEALSSGAQSVACSPVAGVAGIGGVQ